MSRLCGRMLVMLTLLSGAAAGAQPLASDLAEGWRASGQYFTWTSTLPENQGRRAG